MCHIVKDWAGSKKDPKVIELRQNSTNNVSLFTKSFPKAARTTYHSLQECITITLLFILHLLFFKPSGVPCFFVDASSCTAPRRSVLIWETIAWFLCCKNSRWSQIIWSYKAVTILFGYWFRGIHWLTMTPQQIQNQPRGKHWFCFGYTIGCKDRNTISEKQERKKLLAIKQRPS